MVISLDGIDVPAAEQRILLKEIQEALALLICRQARGEITHKQFFEAMEAWERCFRDAPEGDYTTEKLIKLATSHCL